MADKRRRWLLSVVALTSGAAVAATLFSMSLHLTSGVADRTLPELVENIATLSLMVLAFGIPAALLIGYPFHALLYRLNIRIAPAYCLAGAVAAYVGSALIFRTLVPPMTWQVIGLGVIGAYVAWLVRRPDLDAPA